MVSKFHYECIAAFVAMFFLLVGRAMPYDASWRLANGLSGYTMRTHPAKFFLEAISIDVRVRGEEYGSEIPKTF